MHNDSYSHFFSPEEENEWPEYYEPYPEGLYYSYSESYIPLEDGGYGFESDDTLYYDFDDSETGVCDLYDIYAYYYDNDYDGWCEDEFTEIERNFELL